jgi:hypothetical protein
MVRATPRRHGTDQIAGRITRLGSDPSILRVVVDFVDTRTMLAGQASQRKRDYLKKGFAVVTAAGSHDAPFDLGDPLGFGDAGPRAAPEPDDDELADAAAAIAALYG